MDLTNARALRKAILDGFKTVSGADENVWDDMMMTLCHRLLTDPPADSAAAIVLLFTDEQSIQYAKHLSATIIGMTEWSRADCQKSLDIMVRAVKPASTITDIATLKHKARDFELALIALKADISKHQALMDTIEQQQTN